MRITIDEKEKETRFENLNCGDVFAYDGNFYIKTHDVEFCGLESNCVNLSDGASGLIVECEWVRPYDAELILTEREV